MVVTANRQVEFDGLDLTGPTFEIQSITGLASTPPLRTGDITVAGRDGQRFGLDLLDMRTVVIELAIYTDGLSESAFYDAVAAVRTTFRPRARSEGVLSFILGGVAGGEAARLHCRPRGLDIPVEPSYWCEYVPALIQLVAADPLIYSDALYSQTTTLPSSGGGLTFDVTGDLIFGTASVGGAIFADNAGSWDTEPLLRIDGPAINPRIENVTTGEFMRLTMSIANGDFVVIDGRNRTVLLNGTASRYEALSADSTWWQLQPGVNEVTFRATTPTAATLTLAWRSAWA